MNILQSWTRRPATGWACPPPLLNEGGNARVEFSVHTTVHQRGSERYLGCKQHSTYGWTRPLHSPSEVGRDRCAEPWGARDGKNQSSQDPPTAGGGVVVTGWPGEISSSE